MLDSVVAPVTFSVLDSVAAPELRLLNVVPPASSVPATTVLPVLPATVNLFDEIASDPSDAVTANFDTVHVHVACHIQRARQRRHPACSTALPPPVTFNVLDSVVAPVTSSVLDSVAAPELRLLNVVPPASSVPATTVLPVSPATVNLFDEIASDPSDAVTANFPLFTSTSPATSSVLDSVAAPVTFNVLDSVVAPVTSSVLDSVAAPELRLLNVVPPASSVPATTVLPVLPATVNLFVWIAKDPSDPDTTNLRAPTAPILTSDTTPSVLDSVVAPPTLSVLSSVAAPITSRVFDIVVVPV